MCARVCLCARSSAIECVLVYIGHSLRAHTHSISPSSLSQFSLLHYLYLQRATADNSIAMQQLKNGTRKKRITCKYTSCIFTCKYTCTLLSVRRKRKHVFDQFNNSEKMHTSSHFQFVMEHAYSFWYEFEKTYVRFRLINLHMIRMIGNSRLAHHIEKPVNL